MKKNRVPLLVAVLAVAALALLPLAMRAPSGVPTVSITLLGYTNWHGFLCAKVVLTNGGASPISYESQATGPGGWLKTETTNGWEEGALGVMTGSTV